MKQLIWIVVYAGFLTGASWAASDLNADLNGEDVSIHLESPFSELPDGGTVPLRVTIKNDLPNRGTWRLRFNSNTGYGDSGRACILEQELSVEGKSSASIDILMPLPVPPNRQRGNLSMNASGPGFRNGMGIASSSYITARHESDVMPFSLLGQELLGASGMGPLETYSKKGGNDFCGGMVEAVRLPTDWRAYAGVASLLLLDKEWFKLSRSQQYALRDYIALGGHLTVFTTENEESSIPQLQLPGGHTGAYGFGTIAVKCVESIPPSVQTLERTISQSHALSFTRVDEGFNAWGMREWAGNLSIATGFVLVFVLVFGVVVGPLNLFAFARGTNRIRLFWTTPIISLAACCLLVASILATDGLGGRGTRMITIVSLPEFNREVVMQEQVARTALLFSNNWCNTQDYLITPVSSKSLANSAQAANSASSSSYDWTGGTYHQNGNRLSGDWFHRRAIVGHYLQAARPSRSTIIVENVVAVDAGTEAPVILSSFPNELSEVYIIDSQGKYWGCKALVPGRKEKCIPTTEENYRKFWKELYSKAGGKIRPALQAVIDRPGYFYASGQIPEELTLATLSEIRWKPAEGIYLGRCFPIPTPTPQPSAVTDSSTPEKMTTPEVAQ